MEAHKFKAKAGSRVDLFNLKTGDKQSFHAIDAKLCLERGGWSLDAPVAASPEPVELGTQEKAPDAPSAPEPVNQGEQAVTEKPAPVRRKANA